MPTSTLDKPFYTISRETLEKVLDVLFERQVYYVAYDGDEMVHDDDEVILAYSSLMLEILPK
jgi:hypothetical protein